MTWAYIIFGLYVLFLVASQPWKTKDRPPVAKSRGNAVYSQNARGEGDVTDPHFWY